MTYPENYRYSKEHQWVHAQGDVAIVGITFYAQAKLGVIVYVDLPKAGSRVEAGKSFGSVESVSAIFHLYTPISGEVVEINETLAASPETLNADPHGTAWLMKLRIEKGVESGNLLSAAEYQAYAESES
jgi:glycine cleavage system H protein